MNFAFISRHQPTAEQIDLATEQGITLYTVGDADAFTVQGKPVQFTAKTLHLFDLRD